MVAGERFREIKEEILKNNGINNKLLDPVHSEKEAFFKQKGQRDSIVLMHENTKEIRDYFSISKRHAELSFWLAILNCLVGIVLLCLSVYYALSRPNIEPSILAAVAGAISEIFAAASLNVHKKSLIQLNHYYKALHENEMFLSTLNIVRSLSIEKRDELYIEIIRNELNVRNIKVSANNSDYKKV